jgi:hypothetical protein
VEIRPLAQLFRTPSGGAFFLPVPQLSDFVTHFIFAPHEECDGLLNEIAASDIVLQIE